MIDIVIHQVFWTILAFPFFIFIFVQLISKNIKKAKDGRKQYVLCISEEIEKNIKNQEKYEKKLYQLTQQNTYKILEYKNKQLLQNNQEWGKILSEEKKNLILNKKNKKNSFEISNEFLKQISESLKQRFDNA